MREKTEFFKYLKIEGKNDVMKIIEFFIEGRELNFTVEDIGEILKIKNLQLHLDGLTLNKILFKDGNYYNLNNENHVSKYYIEKFDLMLSKILNEGVIV